jgi:uncharacterized phiE125 gp8 family phage protein
MAFLIVDDIFESPEVISLSIAKKQLKIEPEDQEDDELILSYIDSAITYAENYTGSVIQKQKFIVKGKDFDDVGGFSKQKIISVDSVEYLDESSQLKLLLEDQYRLESVDKLENKLVFETDLPKVKPNIYDAVKMKVTCGYEKVPKPIIQALLLIVTDFYQYRSDRKKDHLTSAHNLLSPYKIHY